MGRRGDTVYMSLFFKFILFKVHSISLLLDLPLELRMFKQYFKCIRIIKYYYKEQFCISSLPNL